ncbi:hypothetical protein EYF80_002228 [Liparis tanakae]|uniref:Uncharacterized protein n=1 Tax=Liparis tanakae TaxID=230148 RepID=A0A4Z2JBX6_9TELE|nr:hypothetical protein EYF80_002228 [Liparis tanakae]
MNPCGVKVTSKCSSGQVGQVIVTRSEFERDVSRIERRARRLVRVQEESVRLSAGFFQNVCRQIQRLFTAVSPKRLCRPGSISLSPESSVDSAAESTAGQLSGSSSVIRLISPTNLLTATPQTFTFNASRRTFMIASSGQGPFSFWVMIGVFSSLHLIHLMWYMDWPAARSFGHDVLVPSAPCSPCRARASPLSSSPSLFRSELGQELRLEKDSSESMLRDSPPRLGSGSHPLGNPSDKV